MSEVEGELRWWGKRLDTEFKHIKLVIISDVHYGHPLFSMKHFQRTLDFIAQNDDCYSFLNGDLLETATKSSLGNVYTQTKSPKHQRDDIIDLLLPIKNKLLGMTCLTDDTLILTDSGWKSCYEILITDKVFSLNAETNESEYAELKGIFTKPWNGEIIELGGQRQSQQLTPDHWVLYWNDFKNKYEYRQAETLPDDLHHISIPITRPYLKGTSPLTDDEVMFLAWVITEGHICTKRSVKPVIEISQSIGDNTQELESLFRRLGLSPNIHYHKGRQQRTNEANWVCYYFPFDQAKRFINLLDGKKEIPQILLNLTYPQLKLLYETLLKGDGDVSRHTYFTANKNLAMQVLELCLKLGFGASLTTRKRNQTYRGYSSPVNTVGYIVQKYRYSDACPRKKKTHLYKGNVFCLSTSMGNFMAMRDGHPFFTGNTGNHEWRICKDSDSDFSEDISKALSIPYRPSGMALKIIFGEGNDYHKGKPFVFKGYCTHGYGGARTKAAKAVKAERLAAYVQSDFYAMSHDHDVNVAPLITLSADDRSLPDAKYPDFVSGKVTAHGAKLIKTNAYLKWGDYSEMGGFAPTALETPVIFLLTPESPLWSLCPDKPQQAVKVLV